MFCSHAMLLISISSLKFLRDCSIKTTTCTACASAWALSSALLPLRFCTFIGLTLRAAGFCTGLLCRGLHLARTFGWVLIELEACALCHTQCVLTRNCILHARLLANYGDFRIHTAEAFSPPLCNVCGRSPVGRTCAHHSCCSSSSSGSFAMLLVDASFAFAVRVDLAMP